MNNTQRNKAISLLSDEYLHIRKTKESSNKAYGMFLMLCNLTDIETARQIDLEAKIEADKFFNMQLK